MLVTVGCIATVTSSHVAAMLGITVSIKKIGPFSLFARHRAFKPAEFVRVDAPVELRVGRTMGEILRWNTINGFINIAS